MVTVPRLPPEPPAFGLAPTGLGEKLFALALTEEIPRYVAVFRGDSKLELISCSAGRYRYLLIDTDNFNVVSKLPQCAWGRHMYNHNRLEVQDQ